MTQQSMFWYSTVTGDAGGYSDDQFAAFVEAIVGGRTGVTTGLAVRESSPLARSITVQPGRAVIKGRIYVLDAEETLSLDANTSGNPRIDRAILRADYAAQTIRLALLTGIPAVTPTVPTLTQVTDTLWELGLARVLVANGVSTITESDITPERSFVSAVPAGATIPYAGPESSVPDGWLLCDGRAVSRTTWRDLFECIGTVHGAGDGVTTFNLPDMRGVTPVGLDNMGGASADRVTAAEGDMLGAFYGEQDHTLTVDESAPHAHGMTILQVVNTIDDQQQINIIQPGASGASPTSTVGGGQPHNTMQPSRFLNFIIRA